MTERQLDLYMNMNKDLVWELKATHFKFAQFLEGAGIRLGLGEAFMVVAKFSVGIQTKILRFL